MPRVSLSVHYVAEQTDLSDKAFRLQLFAWSVAAQELTDGHLSKELLHRIRAFAPSWAKPRHIEELVDAGLWVPDDAGGYTLVGWLDYNRTRAQVAKELKKWREAKRRERARAKARKQGEGAAVGVATSDGGHGVIADDHR